MKRPLLLNLFFVLILSAFLAPSKADAQVLYKVNFHDKSYNRYEGLLVYFNDSYAYMRIGYYSTDKRYHVVNVDYKSTTGNLSDGRQYFFMSGSNPRFITEKSTDQTYNPDYFIWRKGKYDDTWDVSTTDDKDLTPGSEIPVDSFYQVEPTNVGETFLRKFFWTNETEYASLKKLCGIDNTIKRVTTPVTTTNYGNAKLHLIVVANTLISDIGPSCIADRDKLDYEFSNISDALGLTYRKYVVDGTNFNKESDNQTDVYPMMDLRTSSYISITEQTTMPLSYVYNELKGKGARLNLVLADCCNNKIGLTQVTANSFLNLQADNRPDITKLKKLFMNAKGSLISAAAKAGEYSWANYLGGFYTISFIQALKEKIGYMNTGSYSWNDIISYTTTLARNKTLPDLCNNCTIQNGISSITVTY